MPEAANDNEAMPGLEAKAIGREEFAQLLPRMRESLKYNPLDNSKHVQSERAEGLSDIRESIRESWAHEHLFAVYDGEKVVGFFALHTPGIGQVAQGQQLWTAYSGEKQRSIVRALFAKAQEDLLQHGYRRIVLEAPEPSRELKGLTGEQAFRGGKILLRKPDEPMPQEALAQADEGAEAQDADEGEEPQLKEAA